MPKIKTITLYTYDELHTDSAKETARRWWQERASQDFDPSFVFDDTATIAAFMGLDICQTRKTRSDKSTYYAPTIYYSGFWSQGDGACFEGTWRAQDVKPLAELTAHAPQDAELHRIHREFSAIAHLYPGAAFSVKHRGRYSHEMCTEFDIEWDIESGDDPQDGTPADEEALKEAARDLMRWIYRQLEREYEYHVSDESAVEMLQANEYTFTASGKRED